jgi:glycine cleavage system H lipoate-binding protein
MPCPFLKEGHAQYCHAAPVHKLILDGPGVSRAGRCTTADYRLCELVKKEDAGCDRCPHLEDIDVQYCAANTPTKLIPFSESQLSICMTGGYRFCEAYLALARPHGSLTPPPDLLYAPSHFWLAIEESGLCHVGIDAFLADFAGSIDGVTFVTTHGTQRPVVTLTVCGVEWPMTFPNPLLIQKVNSHLRSDPKRLTTDPYGSGWLFSGWELPSQTRASLISGPHAAAWQAEERERLSEEVHEILAPSCDGGQPVRGIGQLLSRQQLVCVFQHFFSTRSWVPKDQM